MKRSQTRSTRDRVWLFVPLLLCVLVYQLTSVSPAQTPTKEYIPLGGRTLAVETFGAASGQISGRKIDRWGLFFNVPGAVLNIDGNAIQISAGEQPFARTVLAGTHTIQAIAPGYTVTYHAAQNSYSHPAESFQSASNNEITVTVPAGGFVDIDWMFTSTTNPSGTGVLPLGVYTTATSGTYDVFVSGAANTDMAFAEVFSSAVGYSPDPALKGTMFDDLVWYSGVDQGGGAWKNSILLTNHRPGNPDFVLTYANSWLYGPGPNPTLLGSPTFSRYMTTITPPNSGFDQEGPALYEWGNTWGSGWVVGIAAKRSGTYGLALTGGDSGVYQDIAGLIPGHRYRIKGFVRSSSSSGGPNARLIVHDTTGANWNGNEQIATTSGFVEHGITFTATSTSMVRIHLGRQPGGSGDVHWDDVTVASANFVNPGFETGTLTGWGTYEPNIVATTSQAQRVTGNYSVALTGGAGGITQLTTNPEPTPVTFYVEGWAKSSVAGTHAQLLAYNGSNWLGVGATLGTQWQKFAFEVTVPANGTLTVFAHRTFSDQTPGHTGIVYWDDLVVRAK